MERTLGWTYMWGGNELVCQGNPKDFSPPSSHMPLLTLRDEAISHAHMSGLAMWELWPIEYGEVIFQDFKSRPKDDWQLHFLPLKILGTPFLRSQLPCHMQRAHGKFRCLVNSLQQSFRLQQHQLATKSWMFHTNRAPKWPQSTWEREEIPSQVQWTHRITEYNYRILSSFLTLQGLFVTWQ